MLAADCWPVPPDSAQSTCCFNDKTLAASDRGIVDILPEKAPPKAKQTETPTRLTFRFYEMNGTQRLAADFWGMGGCKVEGKTESGVLEWA